MDLVVVDNHKCVLTANHKAVSMGTRDPRRNGRGESLRDGGSVLRGDRKTAPARQQNVESSIG
jgi:hypothetical protein